MLAYHSVQVLLVRHPHTPQFLAQRLVPQLYWKELLEAALDLRTPPVIRRSCEKNLIERLPSLGLGEKIALARRATPLVIQVLRHEKDIKVIRALLQNPRMREMTLIAMVNNPQTMPEILAHIGNHPKWGSLYQVRWALVRNPNCPLGTALQQLKHLRRKNLMQLLHHPGLHPAVIQKIKKLLQA